MSLRRILLTSVAVLASTAAAHAATFGLAGSLGATPTFNVTSGAITATFTSPAGNGFAVQDTTGLLTFNTALLDNNFFGSDPLTISFSSPVSGTISIPFAILDSYGTADSLTLTANTGQTARFLASPDALALGEPEAIAIFSVAAPITSVTLNGTNAFAVGDISTTAATTPEPASIVLMASGLASLALRRRRVQ